MKRTVCCVCFQCEPRTVLGSEQAAAWKTGGGSKESVCWQWADVGQAADHLEVLQASAPAVFPTSPGLP